MPENIKLLRIEDTLKVGRKEGDQLRIPKEAFDKIGIPIEDAQFSDEFRKDLKEFAREYAEAENEIKTGQERGHILRLLKDRKVNYEVALAALAGAMLEVTTIGLGMPEEMARFACTEMFKKPLQQ